jgi:hypothetical protein
MPVGVQPSKPGPPWKSHPLPRDRVRVPERLSYDSTLKDLVLSIETSVRLYNCVQLDTDLGQLTIRRYLADPEASFEYSLKTPHLGKKTAIELRSSSTRLRGLLPTTLIRSPGPFPKRVARLPLLSRRRMSSWQSSVSSNFRVLCSSWI